MLRRNGTKTPGEGVKCSWRLECPRASQRGLWVSQNRLPENSIFFLFCFSSNIIPLKTSQSSASYTRRPFSFVTISNAVKTSKNCETSWEQEYLSSSSSGDLSSASRLPVKLFSKASSSETCGRLMPWVRLLLTPEQNDTSVSEQTAEKVRGQRG